MFFCFCYVPKICSITRGRNRHIFHYLWWCIKYSTYWNSTSSWRASSKVISDCRQVSKVCSITSRSCGHILYNIIFSAVVSITPHKNSSYWRGASCKKWITRPNQISKICKIPSGTYSKILNYIYYLWWTTIIIVATTKNSSGFIRTTCGISPFWMHITKISGISIRSYSYIIYCSSSIVSIISSTTNSTAAT